MTIQNELTIQINQPLRCVTIHFEKKKTTSPIEGSGL